MRILQRGKKALDTTVFGIVENCQACRKPKEGRQGSTKENVPGIATECARSYGERDLPPSFRRVAVSAGPGGWPVRVEGIGRRGEESRSK